MERIFFIAAYKKDMAILSIIASMRLYIARKIRYNLDDIMVIFLELTHNTARLPYLYNTVI